MRSNPAALIFLLLAATAAKAADDAVCAQQAPRSLSGRIEHGVLNGQISIDSKETGLRRLYRAQRPRLIEIERIWGHGGKRVHPETPRQGSVAAIHLAFHLKANTVYGVGLWSMSLGGTDLFAPGNRWLLDGAPVSPGSPFEIKRETSAWRTLTVELEHSIEATEAMALDFYARTLFHQPWLPKNIAAGSRVDACAYFIFE